MDKEKIDAMLERVKESGYRSSLMLALAEWAEEKLRQQEVLNVNSLQAWATAPNRKKAFSFAVERFLAELNTSSNTDR